MVGFFSSIFEITSAFDFYKNMAFVGIVHHSLISPCLDIFEFGFSSKRMLEILILLFAESDTLHIFYQNDRFI